MICNGECLSFLRCNIYIYDIESRADKITPVVDVVVVIMIDDLLMFILDHDKYDALLALFYNFGMWNVCRFFI